MKRIYAEEKLMYFETQMNIDFFLSVVSYRKKLKETLVEEEYCKAVIALCDIIRDKFELPNKIFGILTNTENTDIRLIFFPKEPAGKSYDVHFDKEINDFYIEVEDENNKEEGVENSNNNNEQLINS